MDCENAWSNYKNESLNSTTSKTVQQCSPYFCNSSYIRANTNPAFYNMPHYRPPEFPSYNNYLADPCHSNRNSCYNHRNAKGHFQPFLGAQPCNNTAMKRNNCSQIKHLQCKIIHPQGHTMRLKRKNNQKKKKQVNSEKNSSDFAFGPQTMNYINTENNNHQNISDNTANIYTATPESQLFTTGNGGNRNNILLNEYSSNETNLQYSSRNGQTNSNYLEQSNSQVESGTNNVGLDFERGGSIYHKEENINFANDDPHASTQFNIFDDVLTNPTTDVDSMQPSNIAQPPDATKENLLQNAQNTTNLVIHNSVAGEEQVFTLQTICEGQDENGKDVILLLAAPDIQQQFVQGNAAAGGIVKAQNVRDEENTSTRTDAQTMENTFKSSDSGLHFEQNDAMENCQEVLNMQNDGHATFTSDINECFGQEVVVQTSKRKKRKCPAVSSQTQTRCKKLNRSNPETAVSEESGQSNSNETHPPQQRFRRVSFDHQSWRARLKWKNGNISFKSLRNQYFGQFARKYFKEKHINNKELQKLMMSMLNTIGGGVMHSIWCCFETLKRNYNASML